MYYPRFVVQRPISYGRGVFAFIFDLVSAVTFDFVDYTIGLNIASAEYIYLTVSNRKILIPAKTSAAGYPRSFINIRVNDINRLVIAELTVG